MDNDKFAVLLPIITSDIIKIMMDKLNLSEDDAIINFMNSKVYKLLEIEETKMWHFSSYCLIQLYMDELSGQLNIPEV